MAVLYLTSIAPREGKTAFGAAFGKRALDQGHRVGFFKPFPSAQKSERHKTIDPDAEFFRSLLNLSETADLLCPTSAVSKDLDAVPLQDIQDAFKRVSQGKELMVVEGPSAKDEKAVSHSQRVASALGAQVILVSGYRWGMDPQDLVVAARRYQDNLLGVVLNGVPTVSLQRVQREVVPHLQHAEIRVLGVIPEERALLGFTVGDLASHLKGRFLTCPEGANQLVESVIVGALTLDNAVPYFQRYFSKAVITRGDRPDLQWAALETSTRCIVATGNKEPIAYVVEKSQNLGVPIILVESKTLQTLSDLEPFTNETTIHNPNKITRYIDLLARHCDLPYIQSKLSLG